MHFTLICMLRTIAAWRQDMRQNGGGHARFAEAKR
jgi:hypothetical protein